MRQRFVTGCKNRIFVNTSLGCESSCAYCYLGDEGFALGSTPSLTIDAEDACGLVEKSGFFASGKYGSIISIGCFSECWDRVNIEKTKEIVSYFLRKGNPVQLATKRSIKPDELVYIRQLIQYDGQLGIYVSSSSISRWKDYERGTTNPNIRFKYLKKINCDGIKSYLYLKPVITDVTICDLDIYKKIIMDSGCDVIVGSSFGNANTNEPAPIDSISQLKIVHSENEDQIVSYLAKIARVYKNSTDSINYWRYLSEPK